MKRPVVGCDAACDHASRPCKTVDSFGYTLVEILVATVLSLILMGAVVRMFGDVGESITDSRSMLEAADRLRVAEARLQLDLAGITATVSPPRKPENNEGYFEYIEGPITQATAPTYARNSEATSTPADTTVGDFDDILMFTTRSKSRPFVGKCGANTIQSDVAEVAWFLRGNTLHRRVLLVAPGAPISTTTAGYYANYDVSASMQNRTGSNLLTANTLGDLTRRECRFAHSSSSSFPYDTRLWRWTLGSLALPTLPTLRECSSSSWNAGTQTPSSMGSFTTIDLWTPDATQRPTDYAYNSTATSRYADDIILTNVIGFDVKSWDPVYGGYVDLGYKNDTYAVNTAIALGLSHVGNTNSQLDATSTYPSRVYDTYSTSYENAIASDGFDNGGTTGIIDDDGEKGVAPPYPIPLRGIQVKIRTFEPDSKQVREVTVVQDFLPQ